MVWYSSVLVYTAYVLRFLCWVWGLGFRFQIWARNFHLGIGVWDLVLKFGFLPGWN